MRWAIVGAGSMGSVFGAHLALAGADVTLVDVRQDHIAAINEHGLTMNRPTGQDAVVSLPATTDPAADLDEVDVALFLCKGWATVDAARSVAHALPPHGWAVTVQNGLGNARRLTQVFAADQVVPGTTTVGAMTDGPGVVTTSPGTAQGTSLTQIGPPGPGEMLPQGVIDIAKALTAAGLPTVALDSADTVIWTKLAMASSMGCLTAILRRTVKDVVDDPTAWSLWNDMFDEVVTVAHAKGITLDADAVRDHCATTFAAVGHHATSMAADVVAGRRTEVETLAMELVEEARAVGVEVPVIQAVGRLITSLEGSYARAL